MSGKQPKHRQRYFVPSGTEGFCEVTREVYLCWYSGRRQERYLLERDQESGLVSLDAPADVNGEPASYGSVIPSPENLEEMVIRKLLTQKLRKALKKLTPDEQKLIYALFYQNIGVRRYARQKGITHHAVQKNRDSILNALRRELERGECDKKQNKVHLDG